MKERIFWTAREWRIVAQKLLQLYPETVADKTLKTVNSERLAAAVRAALEPNRQRKLGHNWRGKNGTQLAAACDYVRGLPDLSAPIPEAEDDQAWRRESVTWTRDEWQRLANALYASNPKYKDNGFTGLTLRELNEQVETIFQPERRRHFRAITVALPKLLEARATVPDSGLTPPPQETPAPTAAAIEPAPAPQESTSNQEHEQDADQEHGRVYRTVAEWCAIAEEIHRQNPFYGWPYKEHLAGLSAVEIRDAANVALPPHRRTKTINVGKCRPFLLEAFKAVRERIEKEKQEEERSRTAQAAPSTPEPAALESATPDVTPAPGTPPAPAAAVSDDGLTLRIARALAPMMRLIGEEFGKGFAASLAPALAPVIENAVLNVLTLPSASATPPAQAASAMPAASTPPGPDHQDLYDDDLQPPSDYLGPEGMPPRAPRVAVIGPPSLVHELEHSFPDIEFTRIDRAPKGIPEAIEHCERIIGIDKFVNEAAKKAIKSSEKGKAKFALIHGGTSSVKRQIEIWMKAGLIERRAEPRGHTH